MSCLLCDFLTLELGARAIEGQQMQMTRSYKQQNTFKLDDLQVLSRVWIEL